MKSILLSVLLATTTLASPQIFRNTDDVPILMRKLSYGDCAIPRTGNALYVTLSATDQSQASGPFLTYYNSCSTSSWNGCTTYHNGFEVGGGLGVFGELTFTRDCASGLHIYDFTCMPMRANATIGATTIVLPEHPNQINDPNLPQWSWWPDTSSRPVYVGISLLANGQSHRGWVRVVHFPYSRSPWHDALLPVAWAYETTANATMRTPCDADYNFDGVADFFDYLDFVSDFAAGSVRARFNGDQELDFFDYLDFLEAYSEGCL